MLDQNSLSTTAFNTNAVSDPAQEGHHGETILTVLWRFKWLLVVFLLIGTSVGYWMHLQKPTTYRATTQLMFKSDTPLMLDASTGVVRGGIPSGNFVQSLIASNQIVGRVATNPELLSIPSLQDKSPEQIVSLVRSGIHFQSITDEKDSRDRMIAALNFDGGDPQVCVAAVKAVSDAISEHFHAERISTISEFENLIGLAKDKFVLKQEQLEEEYKTFRESAKLEYDSEGHAINPFRERQFLLQKHMIQIEQKQRELSSELKFAINTREGNKDPIMVAQIIGQLSGIVDEFESIRGAASTNALASNDWELQKYEVEKSLLPLEIKLEQLKLAYGESHPEVKAIAMQIRSSQLKLNGLNAQVSKRRAELTAQNGLGDQNQQARQIRATQAQNAVNAYIQGLDSRLTVIGEELVHLKGQVNQEKENANQLKMAEDKNASLIRRIDSIKGFGEQLEQQLSALKLADVSGGIIVKPLLDTGQAYVTGPDLKKDLLLYGMLGLGLSGLLAMLFEASAKMFRSAEDVQRELGVPVLTHIPLDEGRIQQGQGAADSEIAKLDPKLSVVHRPHSPAAEAVRGVRTAMLFDHRQFNSKVFQLTSPLPGDGKSTLAANIGCSIAQSGKKTLLIDLDLRSPRLSLRFNLETQVGLTNVLNGEIKPTEAIHATPIENLDILPCGPLPANPAEALTLSELGDLFQWAREHYDFIIVDTPPLLMVSDPAVVTTYVDAAMLVMRIRRRCKPNAKEAIAMLRSAGARVMGVVINKVDDISGGSSYKSSASGSYQSIGYGYGEKYRRRYQQEANAQDTYVVKGNYAGDRDNSDRVNVVAQPMRVTLDQRQAVETAPANRSQADRHQLDRPDSKGAPIGPTIVTEHHRPSVRP